MNWNCYRAIEFAFVLSFFQNTFVRCRRIDTKTFVFFRRNFEFEFAKRKSRFVFKRASNFSKRAHSYKFSLNNIWFDEFRNARLRFVSRFRFSRTFVEFASALFAWHFISSRSTNRRRRQNIWSISSFYSNSNFANNWINSCVAIMIAFQCFFRDFSIVDEYDRLTRDLRRAFVVWFRSSRSSKTSRIQRNFELIAKNLFENNCWHDRWNTFIDIEKTLIIFFDIIRSNFVFDCRDVVENNEFSCYWWTTSHNYIRNSLRKWTHCCKFSISIWINSNQKWSLTTMRRKKWNIETFDFWWRRFKIWTIDVVVTNNHLRWKVLRYVDIACKKTLVIENKRWNIDLCFDNMKIKQWCIINNKIIWKYIAKNERKTRLFNLMICMMFVIFWCWWYESRMLWFWHENDAFKKNITCN